MSKIFTKACRFLYSICFEYFYSGWEISWYTINLKVYKRFTEVITIGWDSDMVGIQRGGGGGLFCAFLFCFV